MKIKLCPLCNILKKYDKFNKDKSKSSGLSSHCKNCKSTNNKRRYKNNKNEILKRDKIYRENNKSKIAKTQKIYRENNKNYFKQYNKKYRIDNKKQIYSNNKQWRENNRAGLKIKKHKYYIANKEAIIIKHRKYEKMKMKTDINFRIAKNLRGRLRDVLKHNRKKGSAVKDLGCSINELKQYLKLNFYSHNISGEYMTWENYGYYGWHIDHIIPLSYFDLTNREQLLKACHYTNLQPLWAEDNYAKGAKTI